MILSTILTLGTWYLPSNEVGNAIFLNYSQIIGQCVFISILTWSSIVTQDSNCKCFNQLKQIDNMLEKLNWKFINGKHDGYLKLFGAFQFLQFIFSILIISFCISGRCGISDYMILKNICLIFGIQKAVIFIAVVKILQQHFEGLNNLLQRSYNSIDTYCVLCNRQGTKSDDKHLIEVEYCTKHLLG